MIRLSRYFTACEAHSSFVMDCVGGDTKSVAEERDVDNGAEDMQDDLSTENSCVELREDNISLLVLATLLVSPPTQSITKLLCASQAVK